MTLRNVRPAGQLDLRPPLPFSPPAQLRRKSRFTSHYYLSGSCAHDIDRHHGTTEARNTGGDNGRLDWCPDRGRIEFPWRNRRGSHAPFFPRVPSTHACPLPPVPPVPLSGVPSPRS